MTSTITYDIPYSMGGRAPATGDFIRSIGRRTNETLSVYLIVGVREVRRRRPSESRRFSLKVQKGWTVGDIADGVMCWRLHWYSRKSKR